MSISVPHHIFREYDIRGTVGVDLSEGFAHLLGRAYGALVKEHGGSRVAIGHDCRLSSPSYAKALGEGIASQGVAVVHTGMGPTPQLYFATFCDEDPWGPVHGGIQVTGSHNPPDMNGFKICLGNRTLSGAEIQELKKRCIALSSTPATTSSPAPITNHPIRERYIAELVRNCRPHIGPRKLKVVVDAGNGVGGLVGPALLEQLGVEVIPLYCEPDGRFPNHHPDPAVPKNMAALVARVQAEKADCGIAWDGDADRIGVVDERGEILFGDMLLTIFARQVLRQAPGSTIIADVKCSQRLFDDVSRRGGKPLMWKTGHSLVKAKLRETGAALAGEMSGHIFFKHRFFGFDDALYASGRLIEELSHHRGPFSSLLDGLPPMVATPEIRLECSEEAKFAVAAKAKDLFPEYQVDTTDGARIKFPNGWGLVRASNTQPVLVLRFEAANSTDLGSYEALVRSRLGAAGSASAASH